VRLLPRDFVVANRLIRTFQTPFPRKWHGSTVSSLPSHSAAGNRVLGGGRCYAEKAMAGGSGAVGGSVRGGGAGHVEVIGGSGGADGGGFVTAIHQAQGCVLLPFGILEKHGPAYAAGNGLDQCPRVALHRRGRGVCGGVSGRTTLGRSTRRDMNRGRWRTAAHAAGSAAGDDG